MATTKVKRRLVVLAMAIAMAVASMSAVGAGEAKAAWCVHGGYLENSPRPCQTY